MHFAANDRSPPDAVVEGTAANDRLGLEVAIRRTWYERRLRVEGCRPPNVGFVRN